MYSRISSFSTLWRGISQYAGLFKVPAKANFMRGSGSGRGFRKPLAIGAAGTVIAAGWWAEKKHGFVDDFIRIIRAGSYGAAIIADYRISLIGADRDAPDYDEVLSKIHKRGARKLVRLCKLNGGVYVKAGQWLASLTHALPVEYTSALAVLQDKAEHVNFEKVKFVVEEELGCPIKEKFALFATVPLAAASLAQVHHAVLRDGRRVVVKVQYPHSYQRFMADVWIMAKFVDLVEWNFPDVTLKWIIPQIRLVLEEELDFMREARNNERIAINFRGDNRLAVPSVFWEFTTKRMLTMEFMEGVKITDVEGIRRLGGDPKQVSRMLLHIFCKQIFIDGFIHADPHPGNVLFRFHKGEPQIVLLDHGLYVSMSDDFRRGYGQLWYAAVVRDWPLLSKAAEDIGIASLFTTITDNPQDFAALFAIVLTQRFPQRAEDMDPKALEELERAKMVVNKESVRRIVLTIASLLPLNMRLIMKVNNLIRSICMELHPNNDAERFTISLTYALQAAPPGWRRRLLSTLLPLFSVFHLVLSYWRFIVATVVWTVFVAAAHYTRGFGVGGIQLD